MGVRSALARSLLLSVVASLVWFVVAVFSSYAALDIVALAYVVTCFGLFVASALGLERGASPRRARILLSLAVTVVASGCGTAAGLALSSSQGIYGGLASCLYTFGVFASVAILGEPYRDKDAELTTAILLTLLSSLLWIASSEVLSTASELWAAASFAMGIGCAILAALTALAYLHGRAGDRLRALAKALSISTALAASLTLSLLLPTTASRNWLAALATLAMITLASLLAGDLQPIEVVENE